MRLFCKKPVVIEAVRFFGGNCAEVADFMGISPVFGSFFGRMIVNIPTLEGNMIASDGDWIIRGIAGELYACKNDIFEKTYEEVTP